MHLVKEQAFLMKEALRNQELSRIGEILSTSWENKKQMADGITNELIDKIYSTAIAAGATGGKISGAGGGGFMIFYALESKKKEVLKALKQFGGQVRAFDFCNEGLSSWNLTK